MKDDGRRIGVIFYIASERELNFFFYMHFFLAQFIASQSSTTTLLHHPPFSVVFLSISRSRLLFSLFLALDNFCALFFHRRRVFFVYYLFFMYIALCAYDYTVCMDENDYIFFITEGYRKKIELRFVHMYNMHTLFYFFLRFLRILSRSISSFFPSAGWTNLSSLSIILQTFIKNEDFEVIYLADE